MFILDGWDLFLSLSLSLLATHLMENSHKHMKRGPGREKKISGFPDMDVVHDW